MVVIRGTRTVKEQVKKRVIEDETKCISASVSIRVRCES